MEFLFISFESKIVPLRQLIVLNSSHVSLLLKVSSLHLQFERAFQERPSVSTLLLIASNEF